MDDAVNTAGGVTAISGKTEGIYSLVGATVDTTQRDSGIITITYDGTTIVDLTFKRSGSIKLQLENYASGTRWKDQGAVLDVTYNAVVVTNVVSGAHYQYDGANHITNTTGGLAWKVLAGQVQGSVSHRHTATGLTVTFANGSQRQWSIDRTRTYSNTGGVISLTVSGNATQGGYSNVDVWGTNRNGNQFYNQIVTPIEYSNSCSHYRDPNSGEFKHYVNNNILDVILGVDASGTPTTSCPWGYKVTYTTSGRTYTRVVQYWQ
jgi:hypothetical protein